MVGNMILPMLANFEQTYDNNVNTIVIATHQFACISSDKALNAGKNVFVSL